MDVRHSPSTKRCNDSAPDVDGSDGKGRRVRARLGAGEDEDINMDIDQQVQALLGDGEDEDIDMDSVAQGDELRLSVKSELKKHWTFLRKGGHYTPDIRANWSYLESWRTLDKAINLEGVYSTAYSIGRFTPTNKLTTMYFTPSGLMGNYQAVLGCLWKQWFAYYNDEPNIDFDRFFAEPVRIASDGPNTVTEIVKSHKSFCNQASQIANKEWNPAIPYSLLPLYRAIILIMDEPLNDEAYEVLHPRFDAIKEFAEDGKFHSLDAYSQLRNVLMVRTGDEDQLSAPITFEEIKGSALPLRRSDSMEGIEVVRVPLTTAIHFVSNLEAREEAASPIKSRVLETGLYPSYCRHGKEYHTTSAEVWVENVLQEAEEVGFENVRAAKYALRRALATRAGVVDQDAQDELIGGEPVGGNSWR